MSALQQIDLPAVIAPLEGEPLLSLEVFNSVPGWAIVHAARDDSNAPLIRRGEVVVVEGDGRAGWLPTEGGLFLIEYVSHPIGGEMFERRTRDIVQTFKDDRGNWVTGGLRRGSPAGGVFYCCGGPYADETALAAKLIGKVIGILAAPSFAGRA